MKKKVLLGMSGGVDSSVSAILLKEMGYDVSGVTLRLKNPKYMKYEDSIDKSERDIEDAAKVAARLGIHHYVLDFRDIFREKVIDYFTSEYERGRTPNPCIACNRHIKFSAMLESALKMGFDYIATGHYAHTEFDPATGRYLLKRTSSSKDQSYFLYNLTQYQLAHTIFPLYGIDKSQTRRIAEKYDLTVAHKSDSQEICFIDDNDYVAFINRYDGYISEPGDFVDYEGNVLARHKGILHYTIGQRKGLGVTFGKPMYVTDIDGLTNRVTLGEEGSQYTKLLIASDINYISVEAVTSPMYVTAKIRNQARPAEALIQPLGPDLKVEFKEPQRSVTPGQAIVFYDRDNVVGGGTINKFDKSDRHNNQLD